MRLIPTFNLFTLYVDRCTYAVLRSTTEVYKCKLYKRTVSYTAAASYTIQNLAMPVFTPSLGTGLWLGTEPVQYRGSA